MIVKNVVLFIALLCLMLLGNITVAQDDDQNGAVILRVYYSDLYLAFSDYEIDDVPFQQRQVKIRHNDSLLALAKRNHIPKLDSFHLAAALYEANSHMFGDNDLAQFRVGSMIKMPSVGDILYAQTRYETLKVVGNNLVFTNEENQMRNGLRLPFSKSPSIIGPLASNELPTSEAVAVARNRGDTVASDKGKSGAEVPARQVAVAESKLVAASKEGVKAQSEISEKNGMIADVTSISSVDPAIAIGASLRPTDDIGDSGYLGPVRNSKTSSGSAISSDPLSSIVEWKFDGNVSLGMVLSMLAEYIGYELATTDDIVLDTYTRQLPALQRRVSGVTVEDGFSMLAGRGLETVFDHVTRSVKHTARRTVPLKQLADSAVISTTAEELINASGISSMLEQLPADIMSAARRHASRCDSSVSALQLDAARLYNVMIGKLQQNTTEPVARTLVDWYKSPTGREVLRLENRQIDDKKFQQFAMDKGRVDRVAKIYHSTVTGRGLASIAVELEHAGWSISGCAQKAQSTGDVAKIDQELAHGQGIKKKLTKLEVLLKEDMLRSLAYQFSSLSEIQLTEYADIVSKHAGVYSKLEKAIVDAIGLETKANILSALD